MLISTVLIMHIFPYMGESYSTFRNVYIFKQAEPYMALKETLRKYNVRLVNRFLYFNRNLYDIPPIEDTVNRNLGHID
jgi:hypothetical protein